MMAKNEEGAPRQSAAMWLAGLRLLLSIVLALAALRGLAGSTGIARGLAATGTLGGPYAPQTLRLLVLNLALLAGGVGGLLWLAPWRALKALSEPDVEDGPDTLRAAIMPGVMGFLMLAGVSAAAGVLGAVFTDPRVPHPVGWLTWAHLALFLLIGAGGLWGLVRLRPWVRRGPLSPATRKTNSLFGLSGLVATISCLALIFSTMERGNPVALFSSGPVALWVALFVIATWLLSWVLAGWWYMSADEHERRASDVGLLLGGLLFGVATPVWWVAARAGLAPQPDAMILWVAFNLIWTIGWLRRRYV